MTTWPKITARSNRDANRDANVITGHPDNCEACGRGLPPSVLSTAPHAGSVSLLVTKVRARLWVGQLLGGHDVEFGTGMDIVFDRLWEQRCHRMEVQGAIRGPYPTTGGSPAGTNLWVTLGQDRFLDYYYAEQLV